MTADTNECNGVSEGANVEFEGKGGLNSSPCCDPSNAAGDSHRIASGKDEEIVGESKVDAYSSYVFVDGAVDDRVEHDLCNKDPGEGVDKKTMLVESGVLESNAGAQSEQSRVEFGELKEEEKENGEDCEEKGSDFHESRVLVNGSHVEPDADTTVANDDTEQKLESNVIADENRESEEYGECCEEKGGDADDSGVLVNSSHGGLDRDATVANDDVEHKLESYAVVDESRESEIADTVAVVAIDDAEKELESNVDVGENRASDIMAVKAADSESHQLDNGMEEELSLVSDISIKGSTLDPVMEPDVKLESDTCSQDDVRLKIQQSQAVVTEVVESELHLLEDGKEELEDGKEEAIVNVVSEVPVEGPAGDLKIEPELRSEIVICPMEDVELENVVRNDSNESISSEKQVRNGSDGSADLEALDKAAFVEEGSVEEPEATIASIESSELVGEVRNGSNECVVVDVVDKAAPVEETEVVSGSVISELGTDDRNESLVSEEGSTTACDVEVIKEDVQFSVEGTERTLFGPVDDLRPETEVSNGSLQSAQSEPSNAACSVSEPELETPGENTPAENGKHLTIVEVSSMNSENEVIDNSIGSSESSVSCPVDSVKSEAEVRNGHVESDEFLPLSSADDSKLEAENENGFAAGEETESEVTKGLGEKSKAIPHDAGDVKLGAEVINNSVEVFESAPSAQSMVDVDTEDQFAGGSEDNKPVAVDVENVEAIPRNEALPSPQEDSSAASLDSLKVDAELGKRLPCFISRIPRYVDSELRAQIDRAQMEVDKKTHHRDSIRAEIRKATHREYRGSFEAAKAEERAARNAVQAKRQEMESLQLMINRMKNATSIEEIDERIHNMQHMIEHETMPLKEEKQLIREIKQLKQVREQLCANMGTQAEIREAFDQRGSIEKRSKLLKQELDSLRNEVSRTEGITKAAKQKHSDEWRNQNELQAKFKEADELRQEAYANLQKLKKQLYEKNKYFRMYLEEKKIALEHASKGNRDALQCHCTNQVERIMELWNKNDEFRNDYVKNNMMSTLSRLKTLDGRSLGPDEKPPVLQNFVEERAHNARIPFAQINTAVPVSTSETMQETSGVPMAAEKTDQKPAVEPGQKNLSVKSKRPAKSSSAETGSVTVSSHLESEEQQKETKRKKEEEEMARQAEELARKEQELARKEEELRKEEAAAKLREQLRMEERTKAKEAEERKRRQAEKARARAQFKAQKEAELKEKEREKKLRKKERKASTVADATTDSTEGGDFVLSAENGMPEVTREAEIKEKPTATTKRPAKSLPAAKQTKTKPLPMPLRNRGKRKIQTWMWLLAVTVLILALFVVGNTSSLKFSLSRLGF